MRENDEISQRIRKDMADFYENMAQAYFLIGYEYHKLYLEAKEANNDDAAKQYYNNACIYKQYYQDLSNTVKVMRASMGLTVPEETVATATTTETVPTLGDSTTSRTEAVSPEPTGQKKSDSKEK